MIITSGRVLHPGEITMPYDDANVIANNVLSRAFNERVDVTPMKLQKILYFVASEYHKQAGRPLFGYRDRFEAWEYGPVLDRVYTKFKPFSGAPITVYAPQDALGNAYRIDETGDRVLHESLNLVWKHTKHQTAIQLANATRLPGSAWYVAYTAGEQFLDNDNICDDETYLAPLGIVS